MTPEFKAEIVDLRWRGDRSVGQVANDFDLTETSDRAWVRQAERDASTREDGGLTPQERQELARLRRENRRLREDVDVLKRAIISLRQGYPVSMYPFIEAEKACRRNVKQACDLLKVCRAAIYQYLAGPSPRERADTELCGQIQWGACWAEGPLRRAAARLRRWPAMAAITAASASPGSCGPPAARPGRQAREANHDR